MEEDGKRMWFLHPGWMLGCNLGGGWEKEGCFFLATRDGWKRILGWKKLYT